MKKITAKDIKQLINVMIEKNIIRTSKNGLFETENKIASTAVFNFADIHHNFDKCISYKLKNYRIWTTLLYYAMYYTVYGEKPFDIIKWIEENIKPNCVYRTYTGQNTVCISAQMKNNIFVTESIYICQLGYTMIPNKLEKNEYNFNLDDTEKFLKTADDFSCKFREISDINIEEIKSNLKNIYNTYQEAINILKIN